MCQKKKFKVNVLRGIREKNTSYKNVHKVEVIDGGTLSLKIREDSTVLINHRNWETCRIDDM